MTKKNFRRSFVVLLILVWLVATACVPKIQPPTILKNYNDYYAALAESEQCQSTDGLNALDARVCGDLRANNADAEMHILHANILLSLYRRLTEPKPQANETATVPQRPASCAAVGPASTIGRKNSDQNSKNGKKRDQNKGNSQFAINNPCSPKEKKDLPAEIQKAVSIAQEVARNNSGVGEWVIPRSYIILGDLMLLVARNKRDDILRGTNQDKLILIAYYEIAAAHYAQAYKTGDKILNSLTGDRKAIAAPALVAQLGYARSGAFSALTGKARVQRDLEPDKTALTLMELDDLNSEKPKVWDTLGGYLPANVLDERDTYMLNQYVLLSETLAFSENDDGKVRASMQRALRLSVLRALHTSPGDLPTANNETSRVAAELLAVQAQMAAEITIESIDAASNPQTIKLTIVPSAKEGFNIVSIPKLTLKVGNKELKVNHLMENGVGIELNRTPCIWTISLGASTSTPPVATRSGGIVNVTQQIQVNPIPFFNNEDKGKVLEVFDAMNLKRASLVIP